jgi:flagellar M-ring protein FliF
MFDKFLETLKRIGLGKIVTTVLLATISGMILLFLARTMNSSSLSMLASNLDPKDAAEIVSKLEGMSVEYEVNRDGTQLMVASDALARVRMALAQDGLLSGVHAQGYELFDKGDSLGTTAFTQDINYIRALEGELVRSILTLRIISAARVHIVLPKRDPFQREQRNPTASVVIKTRGTLSQGSEVIASIQQLVAAAVPGLEPMRVSVIDNNGKLLAKSVDGSATNATGNLNEQRLALEEKLSHTIESLVENTVGYGKARAQVYVDLNMDRTTESSEIYDPNTQVVRSSQTITDASSETQVDSQGVSVRNTVPTPGGGTGGTQQNQAQNKANKNQEIINYEISKTIRQYAKESGAIKRISIAVMVDGIHEKDAKGTDIYRARPQEDLDKIKELVKTALGFSADRGDEIQVLNMPFATQQNEEMSTSIWDSITKYDIFRMLEIAAFIIVGLILALAVLKPFFSIMQAIFKSLNPTIFFEEAQAKDATPATQPNTPHPQPNTSFGKPGTPVQEIQLKNVSGLVRSDTVDSIHMLLEDYPQEAAKVVNSWLNER